MTGPRSLRGRVALAAVAATAAALVLLTAVVVGTFAFEARRTLRDGPGAPGGPPWLTERLDGDATVPWRHGPRLLARRLGVVGLGTLAVVGAAGLTLGSVALRPLDRLRRTAESVADTRDLGIRLPEGDGPEEVDALAGSLNAMLTRLERSSSARDAALEATRRFAADAGHELRTPLTSMRANLDVLARSPDLPAAERQRVLADVVREQGRLVALLDALQALARGDAATAVRRERFDLADVVDAAVAAAAQRHPDATVRFPDPGAVPVVGWPEGLRLLVDNLVENALRHGRPGGTVDVALADGDGAAVLTVDDDGPGVPPDERERVFAPFARGREASAPGSGLGLALVAQQARLHNGTVALGDAPSGGARVTVRLPATGGAP